jgi:two-component system, chemotaxis family, chemotaxis protein CheY
MTQPDNTSAVLLIEAHDDTRVRYEHALRDAGFDADAIAEYSTALRVLAQLRPSVIVAGFHRDTRDECLAFCQRLKADSRMRAIPIVLVSGSIDQDDLQRAMDISLLALAVPPLDGSKLVGAVKGVLAAQPSVLMPVIERRHAS